MPKVSVIIPVYRAAATIVRCVESLLAQTLADLEVILVDDHGGDDSLELVKSLLANHHRKPMFRFAARYYIVVRDIFYLEKYLKRF